MDITLEKDLIRACRLLFGPEISINRDFLFYIQPEGIKSAFRKKALMTHPDRFVLLDRTEKSPAHFIEVTWAYKQLSDFIDKREKGVYFSVSKKAAAQPQKTADRFYDTASLKGYYSGIKPHRHLLFAEYLYYSGVITWKTLIESIVWQRKLRPYFGEVAHRLRYLSKEQIWRTIKNKRFCEKIGDTAVRMNFLSHVQVQSILLHQVRFQKPIGEYFVESGILTKEDLYEFLSGHKNYNTGSNHSYKKENVKC